MNTDFMKIIRRNEKERSQARMEDFGAVIEDSGETGNMAPICVLCGSPGEDSPEHLFFCSNPSCAYSWEQSKYLGSWKPKWKEGDQDVL